MTSQTNEQALESAIEKRLTGFCLEELKKQSNYQELVTGLIVLKEQFE